MKTLVQISILLICIACKAQSPVISITDYLNCGYDIENAYYKDTENFLNKFEGTWLWQNGNTSLTLEFKKVEQFYKETGSVNFYEDILVGEFKYVENGIVIGDYLSAMNTGPYNLSRNISYSTVMNKFDLPPCDACATGEHRVRLYFTDPSLPSELFYKLILRHGIQWWDQQEYIIADIFLFGLYASPLPLEQNIPDGEYTLLKQ